MANLNDILAQENIAKVLDEKTLEKIGQDAYEGYTIDEHSRDKWMKKYRDYLALATQVHKTKNWPWPKASNVKFPLLSIASMQFAARAYQTIVPGKQIVRGRIVGQDTEDFKLQKSIRVAQYMSYQLLDEMEEWEDEMDRLCLLLPIAGNVFKKTYYDGDRFISELVLPDELVVNYYAKSLEEASRKTQILSYYPNEVISKIRLGEWRDIDLPDPQIHSAIPAAAASGVYIDGDQEPMDEPAEDPDRPHVILEQHCWLDLDEDGYKEPYIVTIHAETKEVLRIAAGYDIEDITFVDGEVAKITPFQYFTNFIFVPSPTSGVYGQGFGSLLGPLNEATNTIINQLIDNGTLNNLSSGFIGQGIHVSGGDNPFRPGEWKRVQNTGDDLRKNIVPLPANQPSSVLFQLLGMMIESGNHLSSVTDIMKGENPGQNQPFSTTSEVLRQGLQVFNSIHKRIHRSLKKEYRKLFVLNHKFLEGEKYFTVLDLDAEYTATIKETDFDPDSVDVVPISDPERASDIEKAARSEKLFALASQGLVNPQEVARRILVAQNEDDIEALLQMPEPQPDFKAQIEMQKLKLEEVRIENEKLKTQYQAARDQANSQLALAKAQTEAAEAGLRQAKQQFEEALASAKLQLDKYEADLKAGSEAQNKKIDALVKMETERMKNTVKVSAKKDA